MAFGDVTETDTAATSSGTTLSTPGYAATPVANDLNALSAFTGATAIDTLTSGFTQRQDLTDGSNNDEGTVAEQLATGAGDDACTLTVALADEIMLVLSLLDGGDDGFAAGVDATTVSTGPESTDNPQDTNASAATDTADEVMVGCMTQRDIADKSPTHAWTGSATPAGAPTETAFISSGGAKGCYQVIKVLTGTGTARWTASNAGGEVDMVGLATFRKAAAGGANPKGPLGMPLNRPLQGPL